MQESSGLCNHPFRVVGQSSQRFPQRIQAIATFLGCPQKQNGNTLLLKTIHTLIISIYLIINRGMGAELSRKLPAVVLGGDRKNSMRKKLITTHPAEDKIYFLVQQNKIIWQIAIWFRICFEIRSTEGNSHLLLEIWPKAHGWGRQCNSLLDAEPEDLNVTTPWHIWWKYSADSHHCPLTSTRVLCADPQWIKKRNFVKHVAGGPEPKGGIYYRCFPKQTCLKLSSIYLCL